MILAFDVGTFLGQLLASLLSVGAITVFVVFLGKTWIEKWLASRFDRGIRAYEHQLNLVLEDHKAANAVRLAQTSKARESEFTALTEAWQKLQRAHGAVASLLALYQEYPDVTELSDDLLGQYLDQLGVNVDDRTAILRLDRRERQEVYRERVMWYRLTAAERQVAEYQNHLLDNRIFIPPAMDEPCFKAAKMLREALRTYRVGLETHDRRMRIEAYQQTFPAVDALIDAIGRVIQQRLHPE
jgi:hypothetical protein